MAARLPSGEPLVGRTVRLAPLTGADLPELGPLLADPAVDAAGYVMHWRPESADDALALARVLSLLNTRSQRAITRLGARREGVVRREQRREDGTFRDTVVFSVLVDEWPAGAAGLRARPAG